MTALNAWIAGNDPRRLKMAALYQFTLRATPVVYYGTEIGMTQQQGSSDVGNGGDAEARRDMMWDSDRWDHDMTSFSHSISDTFTHCLRTESGMG